MSSEAKVPTPADDRVATFAEHRPLLFSIAYRMLGSSADAEDVLQDAYIRWQRARTADVRSPRHYLSKTVTRLAMDQLRSARARREVYVGPWLPEPLLGVDATDPLAAATLAESLSTAFLVLLERLTPTQRAAFLLREVFSFDYADVARIVRGTEANARQLVQRARQHIAAGRPRFPSDSRQADELTRRFLTACTTGDLEGLTNLLAEDAVAWADGGGKFSAARHPITGGDRVSRFVVSVVAKWLRSGEVALEAVNGGVGLRFEAGGRLRAVMTVSTDDAGNRVRSVFIQVNPEKLHAS
jgi:RNA polymerase sigma-70 factor (ECF subfamily)